MRSATSRRATPQAIIAAGAPCRHPSQRRRHAAPRSTGYLPDRCSMAAGRALRPPPAPSRPRRRAGALALTRAVQPKRSQRAEGATHCSCMPRRVSHVSFLIPAHRYRCARGGGLGFFRDTLAGEKYLKPKYPLTRSTRHDVSMLTRTTGTRVGAATSFERAVAQPMGFRPWPCRQSIEANRPTRFESAPLRTIWMCSVPKPSTRKLQAWVRPTTSSLLLVRSLLLVVSPFSSRSTAYIVKA